MGSIGKISASEPHKVWDKHKEEVSSLATKYGLETSLKAIDQGNEGYYLVVVSSETPSEMIYQESIFSIDLSVEEDLDFDDKFKSFLNEFWNKESLSNINDVNFTQPSKLLFT